MTKKRFTMDYEPTYREVMYLDNNDVMTDKEVLNTLNKFADENEELRTKNNAYLQDIEVYREENTHLKLENEQLKQRNENQYNQLTELWEIIEEENWEKLIAMKKQLKEDEERLQKEWVCYE